MRKEQDLCFVTMDLLTPPLRGQLRELLEVVELPLGATGDAVRHRQGRSIILGSRGGQVVDAALLDQLAYVRMIACYGVGYEKVDAVAAARRGIIVTHTPGVLDADVADLTVTLLLCAIRHVPRSDRFVRSGKWRKERFPLTDTLQGKLVGIVGMGRIGLDIAKRLSGFPVEIAYHSRRQRIDVPHEYFSTVRELAEKADALILVVPSGPETENLVDERILAALGPKGILINMSRGSVVDEPALVRALANGTIAGAGLDVYAAEPDVSEERIQLENVVLSPHMGSGTFHSRAALDCLFMDNVKAFIRGQSVPTPVPECWALVRASVEGQ